MSAPQPADAIRGLTILVVEDQFLLADLATDFLLEAGAGEVLVGNDIPSALALLETSPSIGAAVIDINLGGQSGVQLADTLIARQIPFVFVTGYGRDADVPEALRTIPLLGKPYTLAMLVEALVRAILGNGKDVQPAA